MEEGVVDDEISCAVLGSLTNFFKYALTFVRFVLQVDEDIKSCGPIHADVDGVECVGDNLGVEEGSGHGVWIRCHHLMHCEDDEV